MIASSSSEPRRAAAISPSGTPNPMPMPTATSATAIDTRAPTMIIENTSRPKWSVPNQCSADGGLSFAAMSSTATSKGVQTNETSAAATKTATSAPPASTARISPASGAADRPRHRRGRRGR